jgi:putative SOS response-associated peptidase YedK
VCGRFVAAEAGEDIAADFDAVDLTGGVLSRSWNVAPTDAVPVVLPEAGGGRRLALARWGLLPWWAARARRRGPWINARAETAARSSVFRDAVRHRRCLVVANGWYEWVPDEAGPGKRPVYLTPVGGGLLAFAGLYETLLDAAGETLSCAIVTAAAAPALAAVHDRMPRLLTGPEQVAWLGPAGSQVDRLLGAPVAGHLTDGIEIRPVDRAVGNVRHNHPGLITRLPLPAAGASTGQQP